MAVPVNYKNDVIMVAAGTQSVTNTRRVNKGSTGKFCSIWWMTNAWGVVSYRIYTEKFTAKYFRRILAENIQPALQKLRGSAQEHSNFYHDKVTNSAKLYDADLMDIVFGAGKWMPHAPPICREPAGREYIRPEDRAPYWRAKTVAQDDCDCKAAGLLVPSASPELNLNENANGYLRSVWVAACGPHGEEKWTGGRRHRFGVLKKMIEKVDGDKEFFRKLYANANARYEYVRDNGGAICPFV